MASPIIASHFGKKNDKLGLNSHVTVRYNNVNHPFLVSVKKGDEYEICQGKSVERLAKVNDEWKVKSIDPNKHTVFITNYDEELLEAAIMMGNVNKVLTLVNTGKITANRALMDATKENKINIVKRLLDEDVTNIGAVLAYAKMYNLHQLVKVFNEYIMNF